MSRLFASSGSDKLIVATTALTAAPLTIAAWFRCSQVSANQFIAGIFDTGAASVGFAIAALGAVSGDPFSAMANTTQANTSPGYSSGVWHHGCGVFTSSTSRDSYIDGGSVGSSVTDITPTSVDTLAIGVRNDTTPDGFFDGDIAEVGFWSSALSAANVTALAKGFCPALVSPSTLVFHWHLTRLLVDNWGGLTLTATNTTVSAQAPKIKLARGPVMYPAFTAAGGSVPLYFNHYQSLRSQ